jgi:hypothetical protein
MAKRSQVRHSLPKSANNGISARQVEFLSALLATATVREAAELARTPERTAYHWLARSDFQKLYAQARRDALHQATSRLQAISGAAVEVLRTIMEDATMPAPARVSAARAVLDTAIKAAELDDLQTRLDAYGQDHEHPRAV